MSRAPKINKTTFNVQPPTRNYIDNVSMTYGDKTRIKNDLANTPEFTDEIVTQQVQPVQDITQQANFRKKLLPEDLAVFDKTRKINEPVTTGLPFGPGAGPSAPVQTTEQFIQDIIAITGDERLARLLR